MTKPFNLKAILVGALLAIAGGAANAVDPMAAVTTSQIAASYLANDGSSVVFTSKSCNYKSLMFMDTYQAIGRDWGTKGIRTGCWSPEYRQPLGAQAKANVVTVYWGETGTDGDTFESDQRGLTWSPAGRQFANGVWASKRALCGMKSDAC
ncbi:hypothetical protein [Paraburkholderia sp. A1RO-5L]|uniref:hypothetical protein n=1 Tax=Paraburkholderia sp. A1RO-5L TaxID=3028370 RepID=UPI003B818D2E